jgi:hypothetical protein
MRYGRVEDGAMEFKSTPVAQRAGEGLALRAGH